ncbi:MAG: hypothetical protein JOY78_17875 [Pseudonocardia sp.]|nr:hypothetical protein [Pseudonocardia sp.]
MSGPDYEVSPAALAEAAAGVDAVIDELRALGPPGAAQAGRGVAALGLEPGDVGHAGLSSAFLVFCDRWDRGLRDAVRTAAELADDLRSAGTVYGRADGGAHSVLARIAFDLVGDPGSAADTWEDVGAAVAPDRGMPDWSSLASQWADTADDVAARSLPAVVARALRGEDPHAGQLDDLRPIVE